MRTVYLFLLALLSVLCWSCYDDQGNYDYHELNRTAVSGIDPVYRCDLLSRLSIPVVIQDRYYFAGERSGLGRWGRSGSLSAYFRI